MKGESFHYIGHVGYGTGEGVHLLPVVGHDGFILGEEFGVVMMGVAV